MSYNVLPVASETSVYNNRKLASTSGPVRDIRQTVFKGSVPCVFSISEDDLTSGAESALNEVYLQVPRSTYLPVLFGELKDTLLRLVLDGAESISGESVWYSIGTEALRWHWPFGLLVDHLGAGSELPVRVRVHLRNYPSEIIPRPSVDECRQHYMNRLKEADFVRWGNSKKLVNLTKIEQDTLWDALLDRDFAKFHAVFEKLVPLPAAPEDGSIITSKQAVNMNSVRSVPIRVYVPQMKYVLTDTAAPVGDARSTSLEAHIQKLFPNMARGTYRAVVQGIPVPLNSDIGWLGSCLAGPDGWVNVILFDR